MSRKTILEAKVGGGEGKGGGEQRGGLSKGSGCGGLEFTVGELNEYFCASWGLILPLGPYKYRVSKLCKHIKRQGWKTHGSG